ncbi:MAG TPA: hypothetical protein P5102_13635 [Candidatus Competibacteraceae bacterium]|nr:hypothetical protein [Candidatus Competibacteraceae bacterium]HRZ07163.1 hypothetical protein [Candidatus Competibacteraceae bacterium]HSA47813.1 hypothetical protein [Candidatus Competibacteraceae bacterium]
MKILQAVLWLILCGWSFSVLARGYPNYGGTSLEPFEQLLVTIVILIGSVFAYGFLSSSISEWKQRQAMTAEQKASVQRDSLAWALIGYLIVAFFLSAPVFFAIKWLGSRDLLIQTWYWVWTAAFVGLTFIRRT